MEGSKGGSLAADGPCSTEDASAGDPARVTRLLLRRMAQTPVEQQSTAQGSVNTPAGWTQGCETLEGAGSVANDQICDACTFEPWVDGRMGVQHTGPFKLSHMISSAADDRVHAFWQTCDALISVRFGKSYVASVRSQDVARSDCSSDITSLALPAEAPGALADTGCFEKGLYDLQPIDCRVILPSARRRDLTETLDCSVLF
jgi:hypothetical protein